jgi:hypothetical protein
MYLCCVALVVTDVMVLRYSRVKHHYCRALDPAHFACCQLASVWDRRACVTRRALPVDVKVEWASVLNNCTTVQLTLALAYLEIDLYSLLE